MYCFKKTRDQHLNNPAASSSYEMLPHPVKNINSSQTWWRHDKTWTSTSSGQYHFLSHSLKTQGPYLPWNLQSYQILWKFTLVHHLSLKKISFPQTVTVWKWRHYKLQNSRFLSFMYHLIFEKRASGLWLTTRQCGTFQWHLRLWAKHMFCDFNILC